MHGLGFLHQRAYLIDIQVVGLDRSPQFGIQRDFRRGLKVADQGDAMSRDEAHQRRPAVIELPIRCLRFFQRRIQNDPQNFSLLIPEEKLQAVAHRTKRHVNGLHQVGEIPVVERLGDLLGHLLVRLLVCEFPDSSRDLVISQVHRPKSDTR